jgi:uncharacterized zinc-type alcohol dehydrogenase-like protein
MLAMSAVPLATASCASVAPVARAARTAGGDRAASTSPAGARECAAYGAMSLRAPLTRLAIERRDAGPRDVDIEILHCGVCHSDIHQVNNVWKNTLYPCVPGHEIVGRVTGVGSEVHGVAPGDIVAVGALVDSCGSCSQCEHGFEQYCEGPHGPTGTYNGPYKPDGTNTYGGYSGRIVVDERFVLDVPRPLLKDLATVPPLLCAGITTFSPLQRWRVSPGQRVGIVGMGGLGHLAVKFAAAMGAAVTVFSTSPDKEADARSFGASDFVVPKDARKMREHALSYDLVLSTVPIHHDVSSYVDLVKRDGTLVMVGLLVPFALDNSALAYHRRTVASSIIGGIAETRAMLDFCATHEVAATVERITLDQLNDAFSKVQASQVRYRYVVDLAASLRPA